MRANTIAVVLVSVVFSISSYAAEKYGNLLECPVIDLAGGEGRGQSFLSLIKSKIKPELDGFAEDGYEVADGDRLVEALEYVDTKVNRQVLGSVKGSNVSEKKANLKKIGDRLSGKTATLYTLPDMIKNTGLATDRFTLSTYVGLASCGGSSVKLADDNYAYNIHYGTGSEKKDKLTGRSFGASRIYHATDSSYSHYLGTLEKYISEDPDNVKHFVTTIMETLTNSEPRSYARVNDDGDAVLTDFVAIWTAEQTRNLMDRRVDLHWDAALLQVTLLSAFHAGQDEIKLFYRDPLDDKVYFTATTYDLAWPKKNHDEKTCDVDLESRRKKSAGLKDYIGVHYALYEHCGRSGINMSREEWKLLSREITSYLLASDEGSVLVENVRRHIRGVVDFTKNEYGKPYKKGEEDVLRELARYLVNDRAPRMVNNWAALSKNTADLLEYVRLNANDITAKISRKYRARLSR